MIQDKLSRIQRELKAPKGQENKFGGYKYRSCEDILEAVKPHLDGSVLTITDEIVQIGDRYYVKATATLTDNEQSISTSAFARETEERKGMDSAQVTGATSSYARKYALNGLFAIDDTKDADTMDNTQPKAVQAAKSEVSKAFDQSSPDMPDVTPVDLGVCKDCGKPNITYKSGKVGCSAYCWNKIEALPF